MPQGPPRNPLGRLATEPRNGIAHNAVVDGTLAARDAWIQRPNPGAKGSTRRRSRLGTEDTRNAGLGCRLFAREEDLVQSLSGADTGERDLDVASGLKPAQPDNALGEIDDLDRLTHVEHVDRYISVWLGQRMAR